MSSVKDIDALLPQTQCGECGYGGCMPYAEALAQGHTTIDRCPPGGELTVKALAKLFSLDAQPFLQSIAKITRQPSLAMIREAECIGCTKCIQACPVDAIVGSAKSMHSIINHECTGCGLCIDPCPVDCIELIPQAQINYDPDWARQRFNARKTRYLREEHEKQQLYREKRRLSRQQHDVQQDIQARQAYVLQALARVNAKKSS